MTFPHREPKFFGPREVLKEGSCGDFYYKLTTEAAYVYVGFTFIAQGIMVSNDSGEDIELSFDGSVLHGEMVSGEVFTFNARHRSHIYIRYASGGIGGDVRIWAW